MRAKKVYKKIAHALLHSLSFCKKFNKRRPAQNTYLNDLSTSMYQKGKFEIRVMFNSKICECLKEENFYIIKTSIYNDSICLEYI